MLQTRAVAPDERVEYWRSAMRTALAADCRVEPAGNGDFDASMLVLPCGELTLVEMSGSPFCTTRFGAGEQGHVSIKVQLDGMAALRDGRRTAQLAPGSACIVPPDCDIVADRVSAFRQVLVNVPAAALDRYLPRWTDRTVIAVDAARPAAELLRYVFDHRAALDADCRQRLAATALQLLTGLLSGSDAAPGAPRRSRMAAFQRQRVERYILEQLRDPDLSVATIAQALGLSRRYVHRLFEGEPLNVMHWVLVQRLNACRQDIARRGGRSIGDVAYGWGFNSLSHFSRVFKKQFGVRPTDF